jgi:hypothetical protein
MALRTLLALLPVVFASDFLFQSPIIEGHPAEVDAVVPLATAGVYFLTPIEDVKLTLIHQRGAVEQSREVFNFDYNGRRSLTRTVNYTFDTGKSHSITAKSTLSHVGSS